MASSIRSAQIPEDLESLNDDNLLKNLDDKTVGFPCGGNGSGGCIWVSGHLSSWRKVSNSSIVVPCKTGLGYVSLGHGVVSVLKG